MELPDLRLLVFGAVPVAVRLLAARFGLTLSLLAPEHLPQ
jgi:hypothetical protein